MELGLPRRRRRQPLLRDARRLHPAPRPRSSAERGVQVGAAGQRTRCCSWAASSTSFIPNPTFDPIIVAGLHATCMFRGQIPEGVDPRVADAGRAAARRVPGPRRAPRGDGRAGPRGACCCSRRSACGIEQGCATTSEATMAASRAFNRWLDEDWGFAYQDRIFARADALARRPRRPRSPSSSRCSSAARGWCTSGPRRCPTANGTRPLARPPDHDPVWARLAEADVPVAFHLGDSGYDDVRRRRGAAARLVRAVPAASTRSQARGRRDRPIHDTIGSMVVDGVFDRHPTLRAAQHRERLRLGRASWSKRLRKQANQTPWVFAEDPLDTIRRHVWVTPYYEEDIAQAGRPHRRRAACCSAPTGPTARGWPTRSTSSRSSHAFSDDEVRQDHARQRRSACSARPRDRRRSRARSSTRGSDPMGVVARCPRPAGQHRHGRHEAARVDGPRQGGLLQGRRVDVREPRARRAARRDGRAWASSGRC